MSADSTLVDYYARRAQQYEQIYQKPERQDELASLRRFVGDKLAERTVLEIACGTGYWTEVIARRATAITGVDVNDKVLEIARSKQLDSDKVHFHRADVYALPPVAERFTGGFAGFWWSHVPKPRLRTFLAQFHRAFAPGATVVFVDNVFAPGGSTPISHQDAEGNTYQKRPLEDGGTHYVLKNFPTAEELRHTVNGLVDEVEIEFLEYYWSMSYVPHFGG